MMRLLHAASTGKTNPPIEPGLSCSRRRSCLVYFVLLAIFQVGIQNFLPTILIVDGFTVAGDKRADRVPVRGLGRHHSRAILADRTAHHD